MKANTKKNSTTKKLVPAAGSLLISAAMLGTSTYAWFTMSREVEVKGLKMNATVPEDLQISAGKITNGLYLNDANSLLVDSSGNATNSAIAPTEDIMWSNTVQLDQYYKFGRLIPASSVDGKNIFFTPDATKQGQDVKNGAKYYQATNNLSPSGTYNATLHVKKTTSDAWEAPSGSNGTDTYNAATSWSSTGDDGYYIDVPVWIRSSSKNSVNIKVSGYVTPGDSSYLSKASGAKNELYKAVRVAILDTSGNSVTSGTINIKEGSGTGWTGTQSIIDYYGTNAAHNTPSGAVKAAGTADGKDNPEAGSGTATNWSNIYGTAQVYNGTSSIATIAGSSGSGYGTATQLWIRVWLEGEDPECWNQNAGQDWNISLKFEKIE